MPNRVTDPVGAGHEPDAVARLVGRLLAEGFTPLSEDEERIYARDERVLFARGETVFHLIDFPRVDEKTIEQAIETIANLYRARDVAGKALSVFQARTVYVCIIALGESPHYESLARYIMIAGGAILVPVVLVPEINQVVYPVVTGERRAGTIRPRIEYLQYLLGERRDPVDMHRQTVRTFWFSAAVVGVLLIGIAASWIFS